ncbi:MAG: hypothetical protein L3J24_06915 [Xanthomonadales bacterium]|nr:hypothetical protein [Xanthomonadales bacterium]
MFRKARFIWTPEQAPDTSVGFRELLRDGPLRRETGQNRWFLFRRSFELSVLPEFAELEITADSRYQLFINDQFIGRGPCRANPYYIREDKHEVSNFLQNGKNVVAVLVHVYGIDTAWYETTKNYWQRIFGDGGLYLNSNIELGAQRLKSDEEWRCIQANAWSGETPRAGWGQAFIEDFDANKIPPNWTGIAFDDSDWPLAQEMYIKAGRDDLAKGWGNLMPFPMTMPRGIAQLKETPLYPDRVVAAFGLIPDPEIAIDRRVYDEKSIEVADSCFQNLDELIGGRDGNTVIKTDGDNDVAVVVRFEKNHSGHPFIELECKGGEIIELVVSETIPGEFDKGMPKTPRLGRETFLDCAQLFRYTARPGRQRFEKFEWTAVRYAQLVVRNAPEGIKVIKIGSTYTRYPLKREGHFECSDEFLNRLWEMGVYTTEQCTHDGWEDCPGREKRQWVGDGLVHYQVGAAVFGNSSREVDRLFLLQGLESQREDGMIQMFAPGDHKTHSITIPDFGLQWILAIGHYLQHTGDLDTVRELFPGVQRLLKWFERNMGPNDLLVDLPYWNFIEWANVDRYREAAIVNAMYAGGLKTAAAIANSLSYQPLAAEYRSLLDRVAHGLNERLWNTHRKAYIGSTDPETGEQSEQVSQHANALMILWDLAPVERWPAMLELMMDESKLKLSGVPPIIPQVGNIDLGCDVISANTYFSHFVYSALVKAGHLGFVLKTIRSSYGPMLATGTTTLWESFHPDASLCHAFSATPVYQLSSGCLGITPTATGFTHFRFCPQFADLEYARGVYPTPHGGIRVDWSCEGNKVLCKLEVPTGCEGALVAPEGYTTDFSKKLAGGGIYEFTLEEV